MSPLLISLCVFVAVVTLVGAVMFVVRDMRPTRAEDRLQVLTGQKTSEIEARGLMKDEVFKDGVSGLVGFFNGFLRSFENLGRLFEQSESPLKPTAFFAVSVLLAVLGGAGAAIARAPIPLYPVAAICAGVVPLMFLLFKRASRFKKFARQLPDALELIARALRSGHSLASGMKVVSEEMPAPISTEFNAVYETTNLGVSLDQALRDMLKRMPNMDLKFFITAVVIQKQTGGNLAEILEKIGRIVRDRFKILGQVQALTGEGRISGVVLMGLPIALFFAVYYLNPNYVMILFTDPLGKKLVAGAIFLQILGAFAIKKIVNIKV